MMDVYMQEICMFNLRFDRSATNSMYWLINSPFIPTNAHGRASHTNSLSMSTASLTIPLTRSSLSFDRRREYNKQAKSQWRPSSREIDLPPKLSERVRMQKRQSWREVAIREKVGRGRGRTLVEWVDRFLWGCGVSAQFIFGQVYCRAEKLHAFFVVFIFFIYYFHCVFTLLISFVS